MKKLLFSTMTLAALFLASCSSEEALDEEIDNGKTAIQLQGDIVRYIETKSAPAQDTEALLIASTKTNDYSTTEWADGNITLKTDGSITFATQKYYPTSGATLYMKSISPQPTNTPTNGTALYSINGNTDLLLSQEISGSKTNATAKVLTYNPLLTKFSFKADRDAAYTTDFGVTSITFKAVPTKLDVDISTGTIVPNATDAGASDLMVLGIMPTAKTTADPAANQIYLLPAESYDLVIKAEGFMGGVNVTITPKTGSKFEPGNAYTVTIHFKGKEITGTAEITDRTEIDNGGFDII